MVGQKSRLYGIRFARYSSIEQPMKIFRVIGGICPGMGNGGITYDGRAVVHNYTYKVCSL